MACVKLSLYAPYCGLKLTSCQLSCHVVILALLLQALEKKGWQSTAGGSCAQGA